MKNLLIIIGSIILATIIIENFRTKPVSTRVFVVSEEFDQRDSTSRFFIKDNTLNFDIWAYRIDMFDDHYEVIQNNKIIYSHDYSDSLGLTLMRDNDCPNYKP